MKPRLIRSLRLALAATVVWALIGAPGRKAERAAVTLERARQVFPEAARLSPPARAAGWTEVLDSGGRLLGRLASTAAQEEAIQGYGGPVPALVAAGPDDRIVGLRLLPNRETPGNIEAIEDAGFLERWNGLPWREAADREVDAVSGSTVTCRAISAGVRRRLGLAAGRPPPAAASSAPVVTFSWREAVSLLLLAAALVAMLWPRLARRRGVRPAMQLAVLGWLGFATAGMLSVALLAGWAEGGAAPWRTAPALVAICALALAFPAVTGRQFYCTHLCPHGAAQELAGRAGLRRRELPERAGRLLRLAPGLLLTAMVALVVLGTAPPLESFEPFSAYLLGAAGLLPALLAAAGLAASVFLARAWCSHGCATGALLRFLSRPAAGPGDLLLGALAALALVVRFLPAWV
ncbi:MAG TPA: 4Fe-4S binding protein [Planctomycetota bacterium]|nr:4Fe-4S binding protein [Planctomycetota bacterium]